MKRMIYVVVAIFSLQLLCSIAISSEVKDGLRNSSANRFVEEEILGKRYPGGIVPLPYFFNIPKARQINLGRNFRADVIVFDYYHSLTKNRPSRNQIGLRLVMADNARDRKDIAHALAESGLVKDGDVLLTFHPEWGGTGPYPSLMSGVSHAAMAFIHDGKVQNIDMPLNEEQNFQIGTKNRSYLNSDHYINYAPFIHILRPRISSAERSNLANWAEVFYNRNRGTTSGQTTAYPYPLKFNSNYLNPAYLLHGDLGSSHTNLTAHILDVGRVGAGEQHLRNRYLNVETGKPTNVLPLFCSDFVWSLHALRDCHPDRMNHCQPKPMFKPLALVGKGNGVNYIPGSTDAPLLVLQAMEEKKPATVTRLINTVFEKKFNYQHISSGHKKAAAEIDKRLYSALAMYWKTKIDGSPKASKIAAQLNASGMPENYAPISFLINALLPNNDHVKKYDYVATIAFVSKKKYRTFKQKLGSNGMVFRGIPSKQQKEIGADAFNLQSCLDKRTEYDDFLVGLLKRGSGKMLKVDGAEVRKLRCTCKKAKNEGQVLDICHEVQSQLAQHDLSWMKFIHP